MIAVAVHRDDVVAVDVDEDAADRGADPAEATDSPHGREVTPRHFAEPDQGSRVRRSSATP